MKLTAFKTRLCKIMGAERAAAIELYFSEKSYAAFRINTLLAEPAALWPALSAYQAQPLAEYAPAFLVPLQKRADLLASELYTQGFIYAQDLASMLPVILLDPQPNEEVLDVCAAPGSKTSQMAAHMHNQGRIAAVEKVRSRFFKLKNVLQQQHVSMAQCYLKDGATVYRSCPNRFDRILVDAPCSTETKINFNDPESYRYWSEQKIAEMAKKQWPLLHSGFQSLKPGGRLVYSTCSFAPEENEMIVEKLLERFSKGAKLLKVANQIEIFAKNNWMPGLTTWEQQDFQPEIQNCIRILPNDNMNGFFIAVVEKI